MDVSDEAFEIFSRAIPQVEVGGELVRGRDGFIRTRTIPVAGSTAYGPYQMTRDRAENILKNKPHLLKNYNKEQIDYLNRFIEQGELFNKYGYNKRYMAKNPNAVDPRKLPNYDKRFDYGGTGILNTERDKELYFEVFDPELRDTLERSKGNSIKAAENWHGSKSKKANAKYSAKVSKVEQDLLQEMSDRADAFEDDSLISMLSDGGDPAEPEQSFLDWLTSLFTTRENGN
jgi:hypothetical protein